MGDDGDANVGAWVGGTIGIVVAVVLLLVLLRYVKMPIAIRLLYNKTNSMNIYGTLY